MTWFYVLLAAILALSGTANIISTRAERRRRQFLENLLAERSPREAAR